MAEKGRLNIKNGESEYIKFGKGKRPLVVLPGLSYDGFFPQAAAIEIAYGIFCDEFTVYLIDRNLNPHDKYSVRDIADDAAEAIQKLGIVRADIFGASLGSMVAQQLALNCPQLVNKLVLGSTLSHPNTTFLSVLARWKDLAKIGDMDLLTSDMNKTIYSPTTLKKYAAIFSEIKITATKDKTARFIAYINAAVNFDVYCSLEKITAKTLVIGAKHDKITTAKAARETADALHCLYYEYQKYGHAVFDEAPDYKNRIYGFLTE